MSTGLLDNWGGRIRDRNWERRGRGQCWARTTGIGRKSRSEISRPMFVDKQFIIRAEIWTSRFAIQRRKGLISAQILQMLWFIQISFKFSYPNGKLISWWNKMLHLISFGKWSTNRGTLFSGVAYPRWKTILEKRRIWIEINIEPPLFFFQRAAILPLLGMKSKNDL